MSNAVLKNNLKFILDQDRCRRIQITRIFTTNTCILQFANKLLYTWRYQIGRFIAHIVVRDKDSGRNGQVNCSLGDRDGPFRLVQLYDTEYQLVTSQSIDRESRAYYALVITCRDNGIKPLVTNKRLVVNVTDVNDRTPVFLPTSYRATLFERNYRGMVVMQVRVCDLTVWPVKFDDTIFLP